MPEAGDVVMEYGASQGLQSLHDPPLHDGNVEQFIEQILPKKMFFPFPFFSLRSLPLAGNPSGCMHAHGLVRTGGGLVDLTPAWSDFVPVSESGACPDTANPTFGPRLSITLGAAYPPLCVACFGRMQCWVDG